MRRADRLFQIIQILRRSPRPITARTICEELETSKRTVYRDIADLIGQRVPIRGEAGLGYVLDGGFDLPPLTLTPDEIEAAVLGAQWVSRNGDEVLAKAAQDLIAKIAATVPERLRSYMLEPVSVTPPRWGPPLDNVDLVALRSQIRAGCKVRLQYRDEQDRLTERVVWSVTIGYLDTKRMPIAWCELRSDFRHFRTDRIAEATLMQDRYPVRPSVLRSRWRRSLQTAAGRLPRSA